MTMAVDNQQRPLGPLSGFDQMSSYSGAPQFTNPWTSNPAPPPPSSAPAHGNSSTFFPGPTPTGVDALSKPPPTPASQHQQQQPSPQQQQQQQQNAAARSNSVPMPYANLAGAGPSVSAAGPNIPMTYGPTGSLAVPQDVMGANRIPTTSAPYGHEQGYVAAHSPNASNYPPTSAGFDPMDYAQGRNPYAHPVTAAQQTQAATQASIADRRMSQPATTSSNTLFGSPMDMARHRQNSMVDFNRNMAAVAAGQPSQATPQQQRESFGDALDAGRGMVAMSQDATPRNIYAPRSRGSADSYGFPTTHSSSSSISSASTYPYYGSVDSSVTDYSSASEALGDIPSRTLPRPQGLVGGGMPPGPQSMMGQFSSKVSSSTQKKHKCKICDKRFTRPSSLQTHMYSHTGEKPFACDVKGCGRNFSVVSNLRRHKKVHKEERDAGSPIEEV